MFRLKEIYHSFWIDGGFRELLRERVEFTLLRYFQRRGRDAQSPVDT